MGQQHNIIRARVILTVGSSPHIAGQPSSRPLLRRRLAAADRLIEEKSPIHSLLSRGTNNSPYLVTRSNATYNTCTSSREGLLARGLPFSLRRQGKLMRGLI